MPEMSDAFASVLRSMEVFVKSHSQELPIRILLPMLLGPTTYPRITSQEEFAQFVHALRAFVHTHTNVCLIASFPTSLYPRTLPAVRMMEHLFDYVVGIQPNPCLELDPEDKYQGFVHPIKISDDGSTEASDMAFKISRRSGFKIEPWSLPPLAGEEPKIKVQTTATAGKSSLDAKSIDF